MKKKFLLKVILIFFVTICLAVFTVVLFAADQVEIAAVYTTDEHGRIWDWDYFENKEADVGLVRCATILEDLKAKHPNMILFSDGDAIQGTPLTYYHARFDNEPVDPMMLTFNYLEYDAFVVGNHEFNYGLDVLTKAQNESDFPYLAANCVDENGDPFFGQPYIIKEFDGVKVGLLGLTTPGVPNWELPENYAGITFVDLIESAKYWVPIVRDKVDLLLVSIHSGSGTLEGPTSSYEAGVDNPPEDVGFQLAKEVPGIDVIFLGHTHTIINQVVNNVLVLQASCWGKYVGAVYVVMEEDEEGKWEVLSRQGATYSVKSVKPDPELMELTKYYHEQANDYLATVIGHTDKSLSLENAYYEDTALMDLIHQVQMDYTDADISIVACFNTRVEVEDDVTVRDMAAIYIYENFLYAAELTGRDIKDHLEWSARFWEQTKPGEDPKQGKIPGYNWDQMEGVEYKVNVTKPVGERIENLSFQGKPIEMDKKYKVAFNNYRWAGGGGFKAIAGVPTYYKSSEEIRNLIIEWVSETGSIPTEPSNNWSLITE